MTSHDPTVLRYGPLTVFLQPFDRCPDLARYVERLPAGMPVVWFDSARCHPVTGRWSMLGWDPWLTLTARDARVELRTSAATHTWNANPLMVLQDVLRRYRLPMLSQPHARAVGLMGFLSYEMNRWIERLPAAQPGGPPGPQMLWLGMKVVVLVDHLQQRSWLVSVADPHAPRAVAEREAREALARAQAGLFTAPEDTSGSTGEPSEPPLLHATSTHAEFEAMVERALEHIRAGDIFQANIAQRFTTSWNAPPLPLYRALRHINPSPFACWLSWEDLAVVSCSPERLVRAQEGRIDARPIAGTRPRGATPNDDAMNSLELLLSEKERAEHIMLVDLARNDLGRVCRAGSVGVNELMTLEDYSHVIHIVSDIAGSLRRGVDAVDVIRAVFPGGTITGCPKVRCMELLRQLEPVARGLYTGSLGYLGFDGTLDLNIAIRTMVLQGRKLSFHVGAGIVADSVPEREYDETLAKAQALIAALSMVRGSGLGVGGKHPEPRTLDPGHFSDAAHR